MRPSVLCVPAIRTRAIIFLSQPHSSASSTQTRALPWSPSCRWAAAMRRASVPRSGSPAMAWRSSETRFSQSPNCQRIRAVSTNGDEPPWPELRIRLERFFSVARDTCLGSWLRFEPFMSLERLLTQQDVLDQLHLRFSLPDLLVKPRLMVLESRLFPLQRNDPGTPFPAQRSGLFEQCLPLGSQAGLLIPCLAQSLQFLRSFGEACFLVLKGFG